MTTICLNMIVKNESKVILRMLESVLPLIDAYCICDTGSTDDTVELIENFFSTSGIKGRVVDHAPFVNFEYNRNKALEEAFRMNTDYVLLMDADMILMGAKQFDKKGLDNTNKQLYMMLQGDVRFQYANPRIAPNDGSCKYIGVTHEYLSDSQGRVPIQFSEKQLFILDVGDGGSKANKFKRDIELLSKNVEEDPNNHRSHFYLANSHADCGQYAEAIPHYEKAISLNGYRGEVFNSYYRLGQCFKELGNYAMAVHTWMEGTNYSPYRADCLHELILYYRSKEQYHICYDLWKAVSNKVLSKVPVSDQLFMRLDILNYKLAFEYIVFAYYNGIKRIDKELVQILNNSVEDGLTKLALQNFVFYECLLPFSPVKTFHYTETVDGFHSSSPSIVEAQKSDGPIAYIMNVRYVNYSVHNGIYSYEDKTKQYPISKNRAVLLDSSFNVLYAKWLEEANAVGGVEANEVASVAGKEVSSVEANAVANEVASIAGSVEANAVSKEVDQKWMYGIEDVRLHWGKKSLLYTGTCWHDTRPHIGIGGGVYGDILATKCYTQQFEQTVCEKNWVYIPSTSSISMVYKWFPLTIGVLQENNELVVDCVKQMPNLFRLVRGSSNGVVYDNEIWFIQHIVVADANIRRYYHILSVFDLNMNLVRYTPLFSIFKEHCIEYCLGIIVNKDTVILSYSVNDASTQVSIYNKKDIDALFV